MLLEAAGVIDGRNVTTHWAMIDTFREKGTVTVLDNRRYVRHGNVVTGPGKAESRHFTLEVVNIESDPVLLMTRKMENTMLYKLLRHQRKLSDVT